MKQDKEIYDEAIKKFQDNLLDEAKQMITDLLLRRPSYTALVNTLGVILFRQGDLAGSLSCFKKAVSISPDMPDFYNNVGNIYYKTDLHDAALKNIRWAKTLSPSQSTYKKSLLNLTNIKIEKLLDQGGEENSIFFTYHARPSASESINISPEINTGEKISIVMQGPLLHEYNFTEETIKIYRKIFPHVDIILSTWVDEDKSTLDRIQKIGATINLVQKPLIPGAGNTNMMRRSASSGIALAREKGYSYCLKTRTDIRIYSQRFFVDALNLMDAFPLRVASKQRGRIVAFSDVVKHMPYQIPDKNMFGFIEDMENFWSAPDDFKEKSEHGNALDLAKNGAGYILLDYMKFLNIELKMTIEDGWNIFKEYFVFIDQSSVDLYWHKYDKKKEFRWSEYEVSTNFQNFGFAEWLRLYVGSRPMNADPRIPQRMFKSPISDIPPLVRSNDKA